MSRKGNCWDNAVWRIFGNSKLKQASFSIASVSESFFGTLKTELTHHYQFKNQQEAKNAIFEYIEVFYNKARIHSANNYLAPVEFEKLHKAI